jgi:hypothetical protein
VTQPAAGDNINVADILKALNRRIGTTTGDTDGTSQTFAAEVAVETVTTSVIAGRTYRVRYVFHTQTTTSGNTLLTRVRAGTIAGTQVTYTNAVSLTTIQTFIIEADWTASVTGSQTFTATAIRTAGTTNSQFRGAVGQPRSLTIEYAYG